MRTLIIISQTLLLIALAPLLSGVIRKIKNNIRMRKGPGILQPYYNFFKLLSKDEVISENTSWLFRAAPYVVLSSTVAALLLVPAAPFGFGMDLMGDFIVVVFLLALGRFFIALAGLDAGSAFGGMGSSREMFLSSLVEPVMLLAVFTVSINSGSTNLSAVYSAPYLRLSSLIAGVALFIAAIAETSRIPVDNQETHLELTMVHEAMVLEYSGKSLALIELASHIKQIIFFTLIANILFPAGAMLAGPALNLVLFFIKLLSICAIVAIIEVSIAKMRLFRVVDFLSFGFVISVVALLVSVMGF
ncbi:MAG: hypothetical protein A2297_09580 [Elusimicrobia bacterium RIFOXYB2_FULL_48_7]|nr:MAG: hypothetical protein A2297_09580 [Elusimicrobia bacterium RIFOXYB2_FULL_48_7]